MDETTQARETTCITSNIVEAIAAAASADPLGLDPPLYDVVDAEALARLVGSDALEAVSFDHDGREVVVDGDGTVAVDGRVYDPY